MVRDSDVSSPTASLRACVSYVLKLTLTAGGTRRYLRAALALLVRVEYVAPPPTLAIFFVRYEHALGISTNDQFVDPCCRVQSPLIKKKSAKK
jgi:hypothetical protein